MIASNIRLYRKRAKITQIELAKELEISIATLRRWEAGETTPTGAKIIEIAKILNVEPEEIVKNKTERKTTFQTGMLVFDNGKTHIELPPTEKGYEFFYQLVNNHVFH